MKITLQLLRANCSMNSIFVPSILSSSLPLKGQQVRCASILASLSDNPSAYNKRIRRGRGPSSGKGKTSGRGHKGQKQHGKVRPGFEGGQTPLEVVKGKRGFENIFTDEMSPVNLDRIQSWIDQGRLDPSKPITVKELVKSRCIHGVKDGVKLLARGAGELRSPVNVLVSRASAAAISAVEAAGGSIMTRYYTKESIQRILRGESNAYVTSPGAQHSSGKEPKRFLYRLPDPTSRRDIEYYRDPAHRGYLSHLVQEGEGPSLFFRVPNPKEAAERKSSGATSQADQKAENRIW